MVNNLFHKLTQVLRRQTGPGSRAVPFALGRIYSTAYRNWKHDPRPLLFILGSDAYHTVGINIHYIGGFRNQLIGFIMALRNSGVPFTGKSIYELLKSKMFMVPKIAYRKYFTSLLRGKLISSGISQLPEPNMIKFITDPFVRELNRRINPPMFSFGKRRLNIEEANKIRDFTIQTQYGSNTARPFANKGVVIEYIPSSIPQGEEQ